MKLGINLAIISNGFFLAVKMMLSSSRSVKDVSETSIFNQFTTFIENTLLVNVFLMYVSVYFLVMLTCS